MKYRLAKISILRLTKRGIVQVKGKGEVNTYWLNENLREHGASHLNLTPSERSVNRALSTLASEAVEPTDPHHHRQLNAKAHKLKSTSNQKTKHSAINPEKKQSSAEPSSAGKR